MLLAPTCIFLASKVEVSVPIVETVRERELVLTFASFRNVGLSQATSFHPVASKLSRSSTMLSKVNFPMSTEWDT